MSRARGELRLYLQFVFEPGVVIVEKRDPCSLRVLDSAISCRRCIKPPCERQEAKPIVSEVGQRDVRVLLRVGRYDDHFDVAQSLAKSTLNRSSHQPWAPTRRNDDRDEHLSLAFGSMRRHASHEACRPHI